MTDDDIEAGMPCGIAWVGAMPHRGTIVEVRREDTGRVSAVQVRDETSGRTDWFARLKQRGRLFQRQDTGWASFDGVFCDPSVQPAPPDRERAWLVDEEAA